MQHLSHDSLQLILGSVGHFLIETDKEKKVTKEKRREKSSSLSLRQYSTPLSCSRRDTLKSVLTQMHVAKVFLSHEF